MDQNDSQAYQLQEESPDHPDFQKAGASRLPSIKPVPVPVSSNQTIQLQNQKINGVTQKVKKEVLIKRDNKETTPKTTLQIIQEQVNQVVESVPVSIIMTITTLYALFGDDIRQFSSEKCIFIKSTDNVFYALTIVCMIIFLLEILANSFAKPDYLFGFYFWLDIIGTATMFLDIGWITDSMYGTLSINDNPAQIKSVGKASKAGRKAASVIRIIRLVRLVKLYKHADMQWEREQKQKEMNKLMLEFQQQQENQAITQKPESPQRKPLVQTLEPILPNSQQYKSEEESKFVDFAKLDETTNKNKVHGKGVLPPINNNSNPNSAQKKQQDAIVDVKPLYESQKSPPPQLNRGPSKLEQELKINLAQVQKESLVGATLQDRTMKRVISVILAIMISIPVFDWSTYNDTLQSYQTGINRIYEFNNTPLFNFTFDNYINYHKNERSPVMFVNLNLGNNCCDYSSQTNYSRFNTTYPDINSVRMSDISVFIALNTSGGLIGWSVSDRRSDNDLGAGISIIRTIFVCAVMAISSIVFGKDIHNLVLSPIDRMLQKVERISKNPLEAPQLEEQEEMVLEELEKKASPQQLKAKKEEQKMETAILEKLIMKIGALLAVGFGEAGSEIIASNMSRGGDVDPMIPGKKMMAIFGFCDIRNFTDATEVLQTGVMMFVNEIAEIVHGTVDHYNGSPNKNIGDAFLLVWKFAPEDYGFDPINPHTLKVKDNKVTRQKGDLAVLSFLKIITAITVSEKLIKYKNHPGLNQRLKNYSVKMGFGLHMGWAIEGAIGSNFKIDASYLSPNVNMASRLEAATKQFGSTILISGVLKKQLSDKCIKQLRHIDTVTVKGSVEPVEIHTVDISYKSLLSKIKPYDQYDMNSLSKQQKKKSRVFNRMSRDQLREKVLKGQIDVADEFETDPELKAIRDIFTPEFYETWRKGFQFYIEGKWGDAKTIFQSTLTMIPDYQDGPSNTLLGVINEFNGKAPSSWKGFRELTEK